MWCGIYPTLVFNSRSKLKMIFLPMRTLSWASRLPTVSRRTSVMLCRPSVVPGTSVIGAILCRRCADCARPNVWLLRQPYTSRLQSSVSNNSWCLFSNRLLVQNSRRYVANRPMLDAAVKTQRVSLHGREMKRLLSLAKREKWNLTSAIFLLLISSAITMSVPFALGKVIDLIYTSDVVKMKENLLKLSLVLFGVFLVGGLCNFGRVYLMNVSGHRITRDLREKVFRSIMKQDIAFFDSNKTGELINRLSADSALVSQCVTMNISDGLRSTVMACAGVSMMFYMSTELALVGLGIVPPVAAIAIVYGRFVRKITKSVQGALAESTQVAEERISNIRTVKAFSQERKEIQAYSEKMDKVLNLSIKESLARGGFFGMTGFSGNVIILTVLYYGVSMVAKQEFTVGNLSAFLWYAAYVGVSLGGLSSFYAEMNKGLGASTRLWELIDHVPGIQDTGGLIPSEPLRGDIKFKNITFSYPNRPESTILNGFNLNVDSGSIIAVVGHSGSGKSTLFSLLIRLYDPSSGIVLIDGMPLQSFNLSWLRSHIGVVSQEPVLFSGTIRENIAYGVDDPSSLSNEDIEMAAAEANAYDFITRDFPEGFETRVGERGIMLSGGQKQRVAIARALVKNPRILLLDEATSALDAESEHLVQEALERIMKGRTVLTIAHRLSTIKNADQIAVLKDGTVAQVGTYDELMRDESGAFKKLVQHQTFQATSPILKDVEMLKVL
ncbi:LOW QUALITY PROTEIN: ATP-binding cassette sub-family B member 10, mitochondrial [Nilaparvata lugens]|uniref:LOW QUALITY PROTEIN: ATP-binding cassette sub-family B member 10, mitochondrial n=1 Tax=Nilaparvata lugens TaxID=108931 RepID=UPI00193DD08F|nr:LOW QUALITY PROTEIN: ATP-binding cassette sub-family B member 10, mitochondrial [Nilaparvata lugens]